MAICRRAHGGLIRTRAVRFMVDDLAHDNCEVMKDLWWAEGGGALTENWATGDFDGGITPPTPGALARVRVVLSRSVIT
jgi:hypothetical protein